MTAAEKPAERLSKSLPEAAYKELVSIAESKSFAGQLKSDLASVFLKPRLGDVASDLKKVFTTKSPANRPAEKKVVEEIPPKAGDTKKEKIISHLKKVYK